MIEYQRVIAEINLDNIAGNMRSIKNKMGENVLVLAVVKADAYGHGAVEISKVCLYNGADWLGVAISDEGKQLRDNNIFVPVLILGYTPEPKIDEVIMNDLTQTIFSYDMAAVFSKRAVKLNRICDIHIKIDTGMGRIGFLPNEKSIDEILKIRELPNLNITGIFTHFSTADEKDKSFTYEQYSKFKYVTDELEKRGVKNIIRHAGNSAAIIDIPEFNCDMVRAGIILYGMFPSNQVSMDLDLKPAMSIKTHISYTKTLDSGMSIGYGRTYITKRKTRVATVPVGYADGYSRVLSNKAQVIVNGQYAPVIGNICMDQFMIDISEIDTVSPGDEVVIMGCQNSAVITAEEIAALQYTINYEVVCDVGKRVPRVYIKDNKILKTINYI